MKPSAEVICRELGSAAVLVHLCTNEIFELNATGYRIWQMIAEGIDRGAMQARLEREFTVDSDTLDREIGNLLKELSSRRLIVEG